MIVIGELSKIEKVYTVGGWIEYRCEICINSGCENVFIKFTCCDDKLWNKLSENFGCICLLKIGIKDCSTALIDIKEINHMEIFESNILENVDKLSTTHIKMQ